MRTTLLCIFHVASTLLHAQTKPEIEYSTYIGGFGDDYAGYIDVADNDDIYFTLSATGGALTTPGVHQTNHGGGEFDGMLQKRDKEGKLIWSTFFGGPALDYFNGIKILKSGKIAVVGETKSYTKISKNGHQNSYGGGTLDGFLAVFNDDGTLDWATYYGGAKDDSVLGCDEDNEGNILISGYTYSTSGIATQGAYQTTNKGNSDGFIAKFTAEGKLLWGTYLGGSGDDDFLGITIDKNSNIWVCGTTNSVSGLTTTDAYQENLAGSYDGWIAVFNQDGSKTYCTYYGGTGFEQITSMKFDKSGNFYFKGYTNSASGIATPGALKTVYKGNGDGFLVKFNSALQREWGTYMGGKKFETTFALEITDDDNVVVGVMTESNDFYPINHAFQSVYGGGPYDSVIAKFNPEGGLVWSTYFGGGGNDRIYDIFQNSEGKLICNIEVGSINLSTADADDSTLDGKADALLLILKETDITAVQNKYSNDETVTVFPNPAMEILTLQIENPEKYEYEILNLEGRIMKQGKLISRNLEIAELGAGMYILKLTEAKSKQSRSVAFLKN